MSNFVLETKLRELDLLIDEVIINVNNKYKSLKNNIVDTNINQNNRIIHAKFFLQTPLLSNIPSNAL